MAYRLSLRYRSFRVGTYYAAYVCPLADDELGR